MKKLFGLLATASLVAGGALAAGAGPASAQGDWFGQIVIDVEKQVIGTQPSGDFEVEVDCDAPGDFEIDNDEFDLNGDGDSEDVVVRWAYDFDITCTVEESEDLGASSVIYECDVDGSGFECEDDESEDPAEISWRYDDWNKNCNVNNSCLETEADVTITNTFEAATTTVAPATAPPTSAAAAAVAARARFTG